MSTDTWLIYVATVLVFMATPGPSHLLMLSVSLSEGFSRSLATAGGDLSANALQMTLAGFGLAALIVSAAFWFELLKWLGIAYLIWVGVRQLLLSLRPPSAPVARPLASLGGLWLRGFLTSAGNPKAIVFFAALFPQFLDPGLPLAPQVAILGVSYLVIDGLFLTAYGATASWLAQRLSTRGRRWLDGIAGTLMVVTALILGLRDQTES